METDGNKLNNKTIAVYIDEQLLKSIAQLANSERRKTAQMARVLLIEAIAARSKFRRIPDAQPAPAKTAQPGEVTGSVTGSLAQAS